jgi:methylated-DNA-protein-cysteine methyltransferase-like protein
MEDNFFQKVYEIVKCIPRGRVTTYGMIAEYLGSKRSARMVGWALNSKKYDLTGIPAHRVVNRSGLLTGKRHFLGENTMRELLQSEGVEVREDKVVALEKVIWYPDESC